MKKAKFTVFMYPCQSWWDPYGILIFSSHSIDCMRLINYFHFLYHVISTTWLLYCTWVERESYRIWATLSCLNDDPVRLPHWIIIETWESGPYSIALCRDLFSAVCQCHLHTPHPHDLSILARDRHVCTHTLWYRMSSWTPTPRIANPNSCSHCQTLEAVIAFCIYLRGSENGS